MNQLANDRGIKMCPVCWIQMEEQSTKVEEKVFTNYFCINCYGYYDYEHMPELNNPEVKQDV